MPPKAVPAKVGEYRFWQLEIWQGAGRHVEMQQIAFYQRDSSAVDGLLSIEPDNVKNPDLEGVEILPRRTDIENMGDFPEDDDDVSPRPPSQPQVSAPPLPVGLSLSVLVSSSHAPIFYPAFFVFRRMAGTMSKDRASATISAAG